MPRGQKKKKGKRKFLKLNVNLKKKLKEILKQANRKYPQRWRTCNPKYLKERNALHEKKKKRGKKIFLRGREEEKVDFPEESWNRKIEDSKKEETGDGVVGWVNN